MRNENDKINYIDEIKNENNKQPQNAKAKHYSPSDASIAFILSLVVPQVLMILLFVILGKEFISSILVSALVPQLCFFGVFMFISHKKRVDIKQATALNFKINIWVLLLVLVIGIVSMFGFSPLITLFDTITSSWGYQSAVSNIDVGTLGKLFGCIFYAALLPSICEELIFRGIITNGLKKYGTITAVVLSSVLFALMHQNLQQLIYQLFLGGVMAYIVLKTGSIIYTMLLHFFNNFVILLSAHLFGETEATVDLSNAWNIIKPILIAIAAVLIVVGILFVINIILKKSNKKQLAIVSTENMQDANSQTHSTNVENESKNFEQNNNQTQSANSTNFLQDSINRADAQTKFYKNPYVISAIIVGVVFWIFVVISMFKA